MDREHPNIEVLKKLDLTNLKASAEVFANDFIWHYINPELPEVEGDYFGLSGLMDFFNLLGNRTEGSFEVNPISISPLGNHMVVTHVRDTMVFDDGPMEIDAVVLWCIMDGKIKEAWDIPVIRTAKVLGS